MDRLEHIKKRWLDVTGIGHPIIEEHLQDDIQHMVDLIEEKRNMDMLTTMVKMQKTLQETAMGYDFDNMSSQDRTAYIKEMSIHINQELNELLYELPFFKPWKDYSNMTDAEIADAFTKASKEFIDLVHFMLNVGIALNMTSSTMFTEYYMKNKENYERQLEGYTHDKRYR